MILALSSLGCTRPTGPPLDVADRGPVGPLGRALAVRVVGPVWAACEADDDADERHLVERRDGDELVVLGLLADTAYTCTVHAGSRAGRVGFRTDPAGPWPEFEVTGETEGYTLLNTQDGCGGDDDPAWLFLVDPEGGIRWAYDVAPHLVCDLDAQLFLVDREPRIHLGGGWAAFSPRAPNRGVFRDVDLAGETLLEREVPDFGDGFNHHSERLADGTYLSLTGPRDRVGDQEWVGAGVELWSPGAGVLWSWSTQALVDAGQLPVPPPGSRTPYIANAVARVEDAWGPAAWVSSFARRQLWRIDRDTGLRTHVFGIGGDLAVVDPAGRPLPEDDLPHTQHDPEWSDGPTGPAGRVLLYDNGNGRGWSRVAEFDLDLDARVATLLWEWTEPGWYDPTLGDADRLPDGHVLVAQGFNRTKTPDSPDVSEVVELDPPTDVTWRLVFPDGSWPLYRAERVPPCDVFGNARFCPGAGERLEELAGP